MLELGLGIGVVTFLVGFPIWLAFILSGTWLALYYMDLSPMTAPHMMFQAMDSWLLLSIPFFIIGGNIMAFGGGSKRLFDLIKDMVGHLRGGVAAAAVVACMIYGAITGSTLATVVAIGSIAIPELTSLGYDKKFSMGLIAVAGALGNYIPPSISSILFGGFTGVNVAALFISSVVPGIILTIALSILCVIISIRNHYPVHPKETWAKTGRSFVDAIPALGMPVIILGSIYGGYCTPCEAAAFSCFYALGITILIYRELNWINFKRAFIGAMSTTCMIYFIIGAANLFSSALTFGLIPQKFVELVTASGIGPTKMLIGCAIIVLIMGCFMDGVPIFYICMPLMWPVCLALKVEPLQFNVLLIGTMTVGQVTPPFGTALFTLAGHFKERVEDVVSGSIPFLILHICLCFVWIFFPALSTWLPSIVMPGVK